jgi:hypothetical protein
MSTPSKFPASAYFGAALLVVLFFLTCFQAYGQVSTSEKHNQDSSKVTQEFRNVYFDFNIGVFFYEANINAGFLIKRTHGFGLTYGGVIIYKNSFFQNRGRVVGLQYRFTPIHASGTLKHLLIRAEYGRVIKSSYEDTAPFILRTDLNNNYYIRGTIGFRARAVFIGVSVLHSGRQGLEVTDYPPLPNPPSRRIEYFHLNGIFFNLGIALPYERKVKMQEL